MSKPLTPRLPLPVVEQEMRRLQAKALQANIARKERNEPINQETAHSAAVFTEVLVILQDIRNTGTYTGYPLPEACPSELSDKGQASLFPGAPLPKPAATRRGKKEPKHPI